MAASPHKAILPMPCFSYIESICSKPKDRLTASSNYIMKKLFLPLVMGMALSVFARPDIDPNNPPASKDTTGWRQLYNGKDLTGWKHVGDGFMTVEKDGLIHTHGGMGLLYWQGEKFGDCTIRIVFRMRDENSNAGFFIRIPIEPKEAWMPVFYGYEVQIDNKPELSGEDEYHSTGMLYAFTKPLVGGVGKPGPEWNTFEITLDGDRTIVVLNGVKVTDFREGDPVPERKFDFEPYPGKRPEYGYIGMQNHGDDDVVFYKEVAVKPLPKTKAKK
jgi:3-keto-disaccharide hydrolase